MTGGPGNNKLGDSTFLDSDRDRSVLPCLTEWMVVSLVASVKELHSLRCSIGRGSVPFGRNRD